MSHGIIVCQGCGTVIRNCRCMGPHVKIPQGYCQDCNGFSKQSTFPEAPPLATKVGSLEALEANLIQVGAAYAGNLILIHDLRKAAEKSLEAIKETRKAIAKGQGAWPYVDGLLLNAIHDLVIQITRAKTRPEAGEVTPKPREWWVLVSKVAVTIHESLKDAEAVRSNYPRDTIELRRVREVLNGEAPSPPNLDLYREENKPQTKGGEPQEWGEG